MKKRTLVLVALYLASSIAHCIETENLRIFNITCSSADCNDESLKSVIEKLQVQTNFAVQIKINIPLLELNSTVTFANLTSIMIAGNSNTTIICNNESGIVLRDIKYSISLKNLKLQFCGAQITIDNSYSETKPMMYISALSVASSRDVEIKNVVVSGSNGVGMVILDHKGGTVNIISCVFENNIFSQSDEVSTTNVSFIGGGGVVLELTYSNLETQPPQMMTFKFLLCTFKNNTAFNSNFTRYISTNSIGEVEEGQGKGEGVNLILGPGINNVNVLFNGCCFMNNHAHLGGGLAMIILGGDNKNITTEHVHINIANSIFEGNGNESYEFGAGIYLVIFHASNLTIVKDCSYTLRNVIFTNNSAEHGGGVYFFADSNSLVLDNCTFTNNTAHLGSAIIFASNVYFRPSQGWSATPVLRNCRFFENHAIHGTSALDDNQKIHGVGTIYISSYSVVFREYTCFENNWGSGIYLVNGVANFQHSSVQFFNNSALRGGALALVGTSFMIVGPNQYHFLNNTALFQGGAIYISLYDKTDFTISQKCFIQYFNNSETEVINEDWNLSMTFNGNKVEGPDMNYGNNIYATSFLPCQTVNSILVNTSTIFSYRSKDITFDDDLETKLASDAAKLRISKKELTVFPGIPCDHGVNLTDEFGNKVYSSLRATLKDKRGDIELKLSYITKKVEIIGNPSSSARLVLQSLSPRESYIEVKVTLAQCPPGFKLNYDSKKCTCNYVAYIGIFECLDDHSYLLRGYWAGFLQIPGPKDPILVTSASPFHIEFVEQNISNFNITLPNNYSDIEIDKLVCGLTRTGIGCGRCRGELTAYFHSPYHSCDKAQPLDCKLGWLFYILSELLPITILFITILVFNVSFTSGGVNGFILFIQMFVDFDIDASGIITLPKYAKNKITSATVVYNVIFGFFDLDMFNSPTLSFCLWKRASPINMLAFKYITIVYSLLLITAVIYLINKFGGSFFGRCCRITTLKISVVHGISTFLILCYSQCIKVSLSLLIPLHIHLAEDIKNFDCSNCSLRRVWFDGNLQHFHKEHLPYVLPALFCLLTIGIIPPIILLIYPLFNKILTVLGLENCYLVNKTSEKIPIGLFIPFVDSFQSCFKDEMRFFAGLYFLYRWPFHLVYNVKSYDEYYAWVGGILVTIFTLHTICQSYIKRAHNIIDALLFADSLLINFLSYMNFQNVSNQRAKYGATVKPMIFQLILIYLPIVVMLFYQLYTFFSWLCIKSLNTTTVGNTVFSGNLVKLSLLLKGVSSSRENSHFEESSDIYHERTVGSFGYREYKND